jgi:hypothetical protein
VLEPVGHVTGDEGVLQTYLVMRKMAEQYDPTHGNWRYGVHASRTHDVATQGRLANCISCHDKVATSDYVFGVPDSAQAWRNGID